MFAKNETKYFNNNTIVIVLNIKIFNYINSLTQNNLQRPNSLTINLRLTIMVKHLKTLYFPIGELFASFISVEGELKNMQKIGFHKKRTECLGYH